MIPEPSGPLWDWLQKLVDSTYLFPNVDEDAADRMGAGWATVEKGMVATIAAAQAGNDRIPAVWGDANGQLYHESLKRALGNEGYQEAVRNFAEMAALCTNFAVQVRQTKNQIWSELIMNAFFFALTFLLPPGIGDLFRWRLAAVLVQRFSGLIRAAAELTHAAAGGLGARALSVAGSTAWEGVEEVLTDLVAQQLDIWDGTRKNVDWQQAGISGLAGILGSPMSGGLNAGWKAGRRLVGLPDADRVGSRVPYVLQGSGNAFAVNSITSPISSELASFLVTGKDLQFAKALEDGWFQAGVLGASRVHSVHAGDAMGQSFFNRVREAHGLAPYVDPHVGPPHTPTPEAGQHPADPTRPPGTASTPPGAGPGGGSSGSGGNGSAPSGSASGDVHGGTPSGHPGGSSQDVNVDRSVQPNKTAPSDQQHEEQRQHDQQHDGQDEQDEQDADQQASDDPGSRELADATVRQAGDTSPPGGPPAGGDSHNAANDIPPGGADSVQQPRQGDPAQQNAEQAGAPADVNSDQEVGGPVAPVTGGSAPPVATQVSGAGSHLAGQGLAPTGVGQQASNPAAPTTSIGPVQKADPPETAAPVAQGNTTRAAQPNGAPGKPGTGTAAKESGTTPDATGDSPDAAGSRADVDPTVVTLGGAAMAGQAQVQAAALPSVATEQSNDAPKPLPARTRSERSGPSNGPEANNGSTETVEDPGEVLAQDGDNVVRRTPARDGKPAEVRIEFRGANQHGTPRAKRTNPYSWVAGKVRHRDIVPSGTQFQMWAFHTLQQQLAALARAGHSFDLAFRAVQNAETGITELHAEITLFRADGEVVHVARTNLAEAATAVRRGAFAPGTPPAPRTAPGEPVGQLLFRTEDTETSPEDFSRVDPDAYSALQDHADALVQSGRQVSLQAVRGGVLLQVTSPDGTTETIIGTAWEVLDQVSPIPPVVVEAEAVAAAGSVEAAAHQELMARLNERAADGSLTATAGRMRKAYYQVGRASRQRRGILSRRAGRTEAAPDRTFQVRFGEQELSVRLPWVEQRPHPTIQDRNLRPTVIELAQVVDGQPVGKTQVEFSDPVLDLSANMLEMLSDSLDAWQNGGSALGPDQLGDDFARTIESWLAARHPGDRVFRVYLELAGRGAFDQLYVRLNAEGAVTGFAIVEAKGPNADLGAHLGLDGETRYAQGHREYVRSLLAELSDPQRDDRAGVLTPEIVVVRQSAEEYAGQYASRTVAEIERYIDKFLRPFAEEAADAAVVDQVEAHRAAQRTAKKAARDAGLSAKDASWAGKAAYAEAAKATWSAAYATTAAEFRPGDVDGQVEAWAVRAEELTKQERKQEQDWKEGKTTWEEYFAASREAGQVRVVAHWAAAHADTVREFLADPDAARRAWREAAYETAAKGRGPRIKTPVRPEIQNPFSDSAQLAAAVQPFLDDGSLEYFVVRALIAGEAGARRPHGIEITEYSMDPDGATDPATLGVPEHTAVADQDLDHAAGHEHHHEHADPGGRRINQEAVDNGGGLERTAETVEEVAAAAGVDLSGIQVAVLEDAAEYEYLDDWGATASAQQLPDGTVLVRLGPASFADRETLAKTLAHEKAHADQFLDGPVTADNKAELEREAYASETSAVERLRAHDQVHDRGDVRPAEPSRHHDPRQDPGRGGPGRHGPPDRGHEPGRDDPRRGTELFRREDPDSADDGPRPRSDAAAGDGAHRGDVDRRDRFLPGRFLVGAEADRAIRRLEIQQAAGIREIVPFGYGLFRVVTDGGSFLLQLQAGPLGPETVAQYIAVPATGSVTSTTPSGTAEVTLSDRMALDEVPSVLARVLAETAAATLNPSPAQLAGTEETPILRPDGDPELDPLLKAEDHGALAEARAVAATHDATRSGTRRRKIRELMASLVASMSLGQEQPNAELLSKLIPPDDRAMAQRFQDRQSPKDNRPSTRAYVVKAVRSSVWSALLTGAAGVVVTGLWATGVALAAPHIAYALSGALAERWLDQHKSASKKPAYAADRAVVEREDPGLAGMLDGARPAPEHPTVKAPEGTERWRYVVRYVVPVVSAVGVGGTLAILGFPALPVVGVIVLTATAKSVTERISDVRKRNYRRARVANSMRKELADPGSVRNQLIRVIDEHRRRLDALRALIAGDPVNGSVRITRVPDNDSPTPPSFVVHGTVQLVENDAGATARAANVKATGTDIDPTELAKQVSEVLEGVIAAFGPAVLGGLLGAAGDKIFTDLEEAATAAQKEWDHARRDAVRGQALLDALDEPLRQLEKALYDLARRAGADGTAPDLTDRAADRGTMPVPVRADQGPRPSRLVKFRVFVLQAGLAALGLAGGVYGLDVVLGLPDLTVATALAGALGAITGGPVARMLFRKAEFTRKDANAEALNKYGVDRAELAMQAGFGRYLIAQLMDQVQQLRDLLSQSPVSVSPTDADYTDRVRAATERAYLDNLAPARTAEEQDAREHRVQALARIDRLAAALDWAESAGEVENDRALLVQAIAVYEAIADEDGTTKSFPDLRHVSPERGRRVTGGPTDQVRAGAARALSRLLGEPSGKPLLEERLAALEEIVRAADAVDAHTAAGTAESLAHVRQQLADRIAAYEQLLQQADLPGGFPRPAISPTNPPDTDPPDAGPASPRPTPPDPLTTPPQGGFGRVGDTQEIAVTENGLATALPTELVQNPQALTALEARWAELVRAGYQVNVTVTKVAERHATVDPLQFTVEVVDPHSIVASEARDVYGPADVRQLVEEMIAAQQAPAGRHRQTGTVHRYLTPAQHDPAQGPVSGEVASNESANRARWSFGTPGRPDEVVLELREVLPPEPLLDADGQPEALPRIALDWAFARRQARALIPPGVAIPEVEFAALEQQIQRLIAADQVVSLRLRVIPRSDGRPELVVDAYVREETSGRTALHEDLSLPELIDALDNQVLTMPEGVPDVAVHTAVAGQGGVPLQDGSVRVIAADGRQVVVPADVLRRITAELGRLGVPQDVLEAEAVRRVAKYVDAAENRPAAQSPAEQLRAAAHRIKAQELTGHQKPTTQPPTTQQTNDGTSRQPDDGGGRRMHAPRVRGTRFVADGRAEAEGPLTVGRILAAINGVLGSDFGGLSIGDPTAHGQVVVVPGSDGPQHFRVRIGRVRRGRVAATEERSGTAADPHVVTFAPGIADSQLARVWVHEISHTLQEMRAPDGGPLRRLRTRLTGRGPNACVDAQFNEFRYVRRQWAAAEARGDRQQETQLRNDLEGLVKAIRKRGPVPPVLPWNTPLPLDPRAELKTAIIRQLSALDDTIAALTALIDSKRTAAEEADAAADKAAGQVAETRDAKDEGAIGRRRAAEAEQRKQAELAAWHRHRATRYKDARVEIIAARAGSAKLLQHAAYAAPHRLVADAHKVAASYQKSLEGLAPPSAALPSMQPSGPLPHLTALTERINGVLKANGIDQRFTATELQQLLSAEFGRVLTGEGVVLRVGTEHRADLRVKLTVDELVEVRDPKVKASEIINGLFPQGGRRLSTAATSKLGWAITVPMKALLRLLGAVTHEPWLGDLTLRGELSGGRTRTVTGVAAEHAQTGAVEDNRGESILYTGKASWQLDVRTDRARGWSDGETVAEGKSEDAAELRAWVSHAYTVDPAQATERRDDLENGRLPAHHLTSVTGLEKLTDDVIEGNDDNLTKLGDGRSQVEEQLHEILTNDLPSRLTESSDHAVLRPLTVDGKPVGHVAVTTRIRYKTVELVGTESTTHWQESVRIGFSNTSTQQAFGASTAVSAKAGYDGDAVQDIDPDGTDVGPTVSGGRSAARSDALSGGGTSIHVGVHRFVGPTQAYQLVLDHEVTVVLDGEPATTTGDSTVVARVRVKDAYRHGLPVDRKSVHNDGTVDGDVDANAVVPGRKLELPTWATDAAGRLTTAGPWNIQSVTGGKAAFDAIVRRLAERGFVPPPDTDGNPDLTQLSTDPIERHAQVLNLEELREQLSTERLEAGYDVAARDGILVTLTRPRTAQATETVVLRIGIEPRAAKPIGVTTNEAVVLLNIGSETAGRASSRSKVWPWRADPLSMSSKSGLDGRASLSYGRQALGRVLAWMTGGTVNQVTLIESTSPVAVFEVQHTLTVSEGEETFHTSSPDESAHLLIDSDLLPYDDALPATPESGPVQSSVLQRMTLLALDAGEFTAKLPKAIRNEATALQQLGVFLNPRNLLSHPEWTTTGYGSTLLVPGIGGVSRRIAVKLTGKLQNAQLVAVTEGVSGDINLALGSHGSGVGQSYGGSTQASAGASENSAGGGFTASLGSNGSTGESNQDIWGVERLTIETGRHYVFTAHAEASLVVGNDRPPATTVGTVFQLAEREALRFYARNELALPLQQVADAVERFLHGNLELDRRAAIALVSRYLADLAAARPNETPALSAEHTAPALVAKLRLRPRPAPASIEARLNEAVREDVPAKIELPAHYREHLGFSLIESTEFDGNQELLTEVYDVLRSELGVDPEQDPALAQALFVDLAGKRWWGRLEDMLGPSGFVRSYPVGRQGELSAEQVTLRIRAEFVDDAQELGEAKDVVGIVQRYLYGDRSRSRSSGRSTGLGADGSMDATRSGSASTDRTEGTSAGAGDQVTRLERIAGFDGMTRVGRRLRLRIEVEHEAAAPTRTPLGRKVSPRLSVSTIPRELTGNVVQLIPTVAVGKNIPPVLTVPEQVELPTMYHVEGVGPADGRADLLDVVAEALADQRALGADGVRAHRTELENKLSASARNAQFSRMASDEGFTLAPLEVPGTKQDTVEVTIRARVSEVEVVTEPFEGELGEVNRHMETASAGTSTGRMLPTTTSGTYSAADASGSGSVGDQLFDAATDLRGARTERSHFEKGQLVTVRVRVDYDLTITRNRHTAAGVTREQSSRPYPAAAVGRAYLTLHEHDCQNLLPADPTPPAPPTPPNRPAPFARPAPAPGDGPSQVIPSRWQPIHTGAATLLAIQRAQRWAENQRRS